MKLFEEQELDIGLEPHPLILIAGNCVIESEQLAIETAGTLKEICDELDIMLIYKSSFDKANRTSKNSFRGLGMEEGLRILGEVNQQIQVPVLTDVHENTPLDEVSHVVDVLQTPSLLCRQTDFIRRVCAQGLPVNIKKGQFMAPRDMINVLDKAVDTGNKDIMLCERGYMMGYNNLVVDMRSLEIMKNFKHPVIFDATHSVQLPSGIGNASDGEREFIPALAKAATAVGIAGLFMETHPNPDAALCDGANSMKLCDMKKLLTTIKQIDNIVKS